MTPNEQIRTYTDRGRDLDDQAVRAAIVGTGYEAAP
jgi:hypothetical protein